MAEEAAESARLRLLHEVDPARDHVRGGGIEEGVVVVGYEDFLCPYCRRLRPLLLRLRAALGDRFVYVYRHLPNEHAHPGTELVARASEAAALQGRFFEMHDRILERELPIGRAELLEMARTLRLDEPRFIRDLDAKAVAARVAEDRAMGRANGVTGTPTLFIDGLRYDGAWDYQSLLEGVERPVAARVQRSARAFASLPTSAGLVLLLTAVLAMLCANTPLASVYEGLMNTRLVVGPEGALLALTAREWVSDGLLSLFFLLVGLEIRREMTVGSLTRVRAALLPVMAALGGVALPALLYLVVNRGRTADGWPIPTATDVAFALALLAVLGERIPVALRAFVAALAVVDDLLSVATLGIVFPRSFAAVYALPALGALAALVALNRARVYAILPYVGAAVALWLSLHALGVDAALTGVVLAMCLPTRPAPSAGALLAQAATALSALDHAERVARDRYGARLEQEPVREWAVRNLSAAADRLLSPAERVERAVGPWSTYLVLPLFAFSATGVSLRVDLSTPDTPRIFAGIVVGLVVGKPLGILLASGIAVATRVASAPEGVSPRQLVGAACLCGIGDTLALLMADRAFTPEEAAVAKLAVLAGSVVAAALGVLVLVRRHEATPGPR